MNYASPYGRPRRRHSLVIPVIAILVALGIAAALFLPTYLTKRSLDDLAAHMPEGTSFTYEGATYGLFSDKLELRHVTYQVPGPDKQPVTITADSLSLIGGNMHLDRDAAAAQAGKGAPVMVKLASQILLKDVGGQYGTLTAHADQFTLQNPQFDFTSFDAPLAPLQPSRLPFGASLGAVQTALQKMARDVVSVAYDHMDGQAINLTYKEPRGASSLVLKVAKLGADNMNRGSSSGITLQGLELQGGILRLTIDSIATGAAPNAPFWEAVLAGKPLEEALKDFQGAPQTITGVHVLNAASEMASLGALTIGGLAYDQGRPTSFALNLSKLQFNLAALPFPSTRAIRSLGYDTLLLDAAFGYGFDPATSVADIKDTSITLDQGGKLSMAGTFQQPGAGEVATSFVPATPKLIGLTFRYDDAGLFSRVLAQQAKAAGQTPDIMKQAWLGMLEQQRQGLQADPVTGAAIDQLEKFIASPQSLTMTLAPPTPIAMTELDRTHPEQFAAQLGLMLQAD